MAIDNRHCRRYNKTIKGKQQKMIEIRTGKRERRNGYEDFGIKVCKGVYQNGR